MKKLDTMPPRHPINAALELTLRCNLKCKMCMFRHSDGENARLAAEELTASQWSDMAQQLFDAGTLNILITGFVTIEPKGSVNHEENISIH